MWGRCFAGGLFTKGNLAVKPSDAPWARGILTGCRGLLGMGHGGGWAGIHPGHKQAGRGPR